jgi:transcriptional regulator with GAF, ATPase, and Fis domain
MSAQTSWVSESLNRSASFEIPAGLPANTGFDGDELCDRNSPRILGTSAALRCVLDMVRVVAATDSTVLIYGETGTGKELIAEAIHKSSHRSSGAFVKVNCAAIPAGLLESELFGHERGAYTGAVARGIGRFERANRGTLFLDEIGDLPLELQPKLLRVLQEREFERLGGAAPIHSDVRVVCATHRNLVEMINERQFRADLFYRLGVFPIELPPLRERPEDIYLLVRHFAMDYAARMNKRITGISEEFMKALVRHPWPGNIRELQNLIERSVILSTGDVLSGSMPGLTSTRQDGSKWSSVSGPPTLDEAESSHILETLRQTAGVIGGPSGAAVRLGLPRTTLIAKMHRLGINRIAINREQTSAFRVRGATAVPSAEDPDSLTPPLTEWAHGDANSGNFKPHSDMGRVCTLAETEREHIADVMEMTNGLIAGRGGAAEVLGLPASTLRSRMKKLGIKR